MENGCGEEAFPTSSRKLFNFKPRTSIDHSDLSKAVVLYHPYPGKQAIGRNLVSSDHLNNIPRKANPNGFNITEKREKLMTKSQIPTLTQQSEHSDFKGTECISIKCISTSFTLQKHSFLVFLLVAITVILLFSSSIVNDKCEPGSVTIDLKLLQNKLGTLIYGQTIAIKTIFNVLEELEVTVQHLAVFVLLGGTGTGKTWTTYLIENSVPQSVKIIRLHLGPWSNPQEIEERFRNIDECCRWNFLFIEDSDYASKLQIEKLLDLVSVVRENTSCSHGKVIVMLTSNYGQKEFVEFLSKDREKMKTMSSTATQLRVQETISKVTSPLLDALTWRNIPFTAVPYLPLEKTQLEKCIHFDLSTKNKSSSSELVSKVIQHFRFIPPQKEYFVESGCKTVSSHVNLYLE